MIDTILINISMASSMVLVLSSSLTAEIWMSQINCGESASHKPTSTRRSTLKVALNKRNLIVEGQYCAATCINSLQCCTSQRISGRSILARCFFFFILLILCEPPPATTLLVLAARFQGEPTFFDAGTDVNDEVDHSRVRGEESIAPNQGVVETILVSLGDYPGLHPPVMKNLS